MLTGAPTACRGSGGIVVDLSESFSRRIDIGLRPLSEPAVDGDVIGNGNRTGRDQIGRVLIHEFEVCRPSGGNHRLPQGHGLGHPQSESLRSMERGIAVTQLHHGFHLVEWYGPVQHQHVRSVDRRPEKLQLLPMPLPSDALEDEMGPVIGIERPAVGLEETEGVLAFEHAGEVDR